MLNWVLMFLIVALFAMALGFGAVAGISVEIARILFVVFIVLFVVGLLARGLGRHGPPIP
jgi:uncharacterized membrane protein YtjA (UPF0391 family)